MTEQYQVIRGMNDILPEQIELWQYVENKLRSLAKKFDYKEIRFPILEKTALFCRTIGDITDIVEKEMYVFEDRNGDSLALRPEGTAGCVRACIQNNLINRNSQKLWYMGPMYRHERPQKGRYRQFYQFGLEAFGFEGPDIDVEMILFSYNLWCELGLENIIKLQINTLGSNEARQAYKKVLVEYYKAHQAVLDEDSKRRLHANPLRILDSKNPEIMQLNQNAPKMIDYLDEASKEHFERLQVLLKECKIPFEVNTNLVRGLDYYCKTVFEWVTDSLGAQGTVCAGGHYDTLVQQLGGVDTPAIGFSLGLERLILMLESTAFDAHEEPLDIFFMTLNPEYQARALMLCNKIRNANVLLRCYYHPGGGSLKRQMKKADKSGASLAIILGEEEFNNKTVTIKFLRDKSASQFTVDDNDLINFLTEYKRG